MNIVFVFLSQFPSILIKRYLPIKLPFNLFSKKDTFSKEFLFSFNYSKKSHFEIFSDLKSDIDLYEKVIDPEEDGDLAVYQNMLLYSYLKNKKNLNVLNIGIKKLASFKALKSDHKFSMLSFADLSKNKDEITTDNFVCYTKYELKKVKSNFDLIFLPSSQFTEEADPEKNELVFSNLKHLLKPDGILLCSFTNIFQDNSLWYENIFNYFAKQKDLVSCFTQFSKIASDPDLFYLSEKAYVKDWKEFTGKSYNDFGTAFCNNLIIENKIEVSPKNFNYFIYPKKTHTKLFSVDENLTELFNVKSSEKFTAEHIRSLIIYSYIKYNLKEKSKLLLIGKAPEQLLNKLKENYSLFETEKINFPEVFPDFNKFINRLSPIDSNKNDEEKNYYDYFDFIFYFHDDFSGNVLNPEFNVLIRHINNLLNQNGSSIISSGIIIRNKVIQFPPLLTFMLKNNMMKFSKLVKKDTILKDDEFHFDEVSENTVKGRAGSIPGHAFYNVLLKKELYLSQASHTDHSNNLKQYPVYVFHHLMKCGGTSLFNALDQWFMTIDDNILNEDLNTYIRKKYNTEIFHSDICLRAHFQKEGIYLHQRYPEVLVNKEKFKLFTFIRDPLAVKISKYYFLKSLSGKNFNVKLKDSIMKDRNFLSGLIPCNESNYKEMLDRYYFIGIVENFQESFDVFAAMTGKRKIKLPKLNTSDKDNQMEDITPEFKKLFRELNELDYKIYEYCLKKFEDQKNSVFKK